MLVKLHQGWVIVPFIFQQVKRGFMKSMVLLSGALWMMYGEKKQGFIRRCFSSYK